MGADSRILAIDSATLTTPVRNALGSSTAAILDWQSAPLRGGVGNPVSLGLYRFSGTAQDRGQVVPWSMVLKMAQSPANVGVVDMGEGEDPRHWNYWKREMYLLQSDLLDHLPPGLAAPVCYRVEERPGSVIWLWLEEIVEVRNEPWSLDRFGLAARHFGRFNGAYLSGRPLPRHPWLSVGLLRQWCRDLDTPLYAAFQGQANHWDHPLVRRIYPPRDCNPLRHLLIKRERFLDALDACPQTLCHHDAYPTNLLRRRRADGGQETVALDWALAGIGPLGEELAQLAIGALDTVEAAAPRDADRAVFYDYLDGLHDSGWHGDEDTVRFAYVASAALRIGLWLLFLLNQAFEESAAAGTEGPVEETVEQQARATELMLDLAEEAHEWLDALRLG
jgi:hypothetical protein